eukprot:TRINITY_DN11465_c0_g5_i1.p1 TRINITY_DN11465_c0_g5~~TRINITY_DN11465_c0_g5_i1.p1  ORF type:complete len:322 (+),score=15.54 TRINITY_DN11465_c0_g5_i1:172-1137(+)
MESARSAKSSKNKIKPTWYGPIFGASSDASLSHAMSPQSSPPQTCLSEVTVLVDNEANAVSNVHQPIQVATLPAASLADKSEDHAPHISHTVEDSFWSCIRSTRDLLSVGSAMHHVGTCVPCTFMKTKSGCTRGRACKWCHHPHEEASRNSERRQRRVSNKRFETFAQATSADTSTSDTLFSLWTSPQTRSLSKTAAFKYDGDASLNVDEPIQLATSSTAPLADSKDHAPHVVHTVGNSSCSYITSTTELSSSVSTIHHAGACISCKIMNVRRGCDKGHKCKCGHHPHEQDTCNRKRYQHQVKNIDFKGALNALWSATPFD